MNFELSDRLYVLLQEKKLDEAIALAEYELKEIPVTGFHKILDRNLLHLTADLANYIKAFDEATKKILSKKKGFIKTIFILGKKTKPAAYYCEMNGFTINYDRWFIDLFSFENYNVADWEWLSDFYDSTTNNLTITGFEDIQKVFQDFQENQRFKEPIIYKAFEVCELLVILRLQELFKETYKGSKNAWNTVPMFVTAHDNDLIYKANNE